MASGAAAHYWLTRALFVLLLVRAGAYDLSFDDLIVLDCDIKVNVTFGVDPTTPDGVSALACFTSLLHHQNCQLRMSLNEIPLSLPLSRSNRSFLAEGRASLEPLNALILKYSMTVTTLPQTMNGAIAPSVGLIPMTHVVRQFTLLFQ